MTQQTDDRTIARALRIIESRLQKPGALMAGPRDAADFLVLQLATRKSEVFAAILLDVRHRMIAYREFFYGTIDGATVHPREIVRAAIELNAASIVFAHNHPSGIPEPSEADRSITTKLQRVLSVIDVDVLDHIIVGGSKTTSMAERGLI